MKPLSPWIGWLSLAGLLVWGLSMAAPRLVDGHHGEAKGPATQPREIVLWAWERPEDLRFLAQANGLRFLAQENRVGVAPLLGTLELSSTGLHARGRRQPLAVPRGIETTAVFRIEVSANRPPPDLADSRWLEGSVAHILGWLPEPWPKAVQIDFDARRSERDFYASLLDRLRAELPTVVGLEITALASWCVGDPWIADLPIDDAVPMFFQMGRDDAPIRRRVAAGRDLSLSMCRRSIGVSTDEPWPEDLLRSPSVDGRHRRLFIFHPRPWGRAEFESLRPVDSVQGATP